MPHGFEDQRRPGETFTERRLLDERFPTYRGSETRPYLPDDPGLWNPTRRSLFERLQKRLLEGRTDFSEDEILSMEGLSTPMPRPGLGSREIYVGPEHLAMPDRLREFDALWLTLPPSLRDDDDLYNRLLDFLIDREMPRFNTPELSGPLLRSPEPLSL